MYKQNNTHAPLIQVANLRVAIFIKKKYFFNVNLIHP